MPPGGSAAATDAVRGKAAVRSFPWRVHVCEYVSFPTPISPSLVTGRCVRSVGSVVSVKVRNSRALAFLAMGVPFQPARQCIILMPSALTRGNFLPFSCLWSVFTVAGRSARPVCLFFKLSPRAHVKCGRSDVHLL